MSNDVPRDELGRALFVDSPPKSSKLTNGNRIRFHVTCKCGAAFFFDDEKGTLARPGGGYDENGHYYHFEKHYKIWADYHRLCYLKEEPCTQ